MLRSLGKFFFGNKNAGDCKSAYNEIPKTRKKIHKKRTIHPTNNYKALYSAKSTQRDRTGKISLPDFSENSDMSRKRLPQKKLKKRTYFQKIISFFWKESPRKNQLKKKKKQEHLYKNIDSFLNKSRFDKPISDTTDLEQAQIRHAQTDIICPICLKYIVCAVTTKCGHAFCDTCILEYLLYSSKCILCYKKIRHTKYFATCKSLDNVIDITISRFGTAEEYSDYKRRIKDTKAWHTARKPLSLSVGMKVDIRSPEYIWACGIIKKIKYRTDINIKIYLIHYEVFFVVLKYQGFPNIYDEEIWESSSRLANYGFFSSRNSKFIFGFNEKIYRN